MMTLMSRTEPARALAKKSFSSSVAIRTRNMVGGDEQGREGQLWGCSVRWGLVPEL